MPRTMTSTASGNVVEEFGLAPLLEKFQQPERHAERRQQIAIASAASRPASIRTNASRNAPTPDAPDDQKKCRFDQVRPACVNPRRKRHALGFLLRSSISLSVPSTCSRRDFWLVRVAARRAPAPAARRLPALLRLPLAGQDRIDEHPRDAADRDRDQEEDGDVFMASSIAPLNLARVLAISAASSAAASRFSSP